MRSIKSYRDDDRGNRDANKTMRVPELFGSSASRRIPRDPRTLLHPSRSSEEARSIDPRAVRVSAGPVCRFAQVLPLSDVIFHSDWPKMEKRRARTHATPSRSSLWIHLARGILRKM